MSSLIIFTLSLNSLVNNEIKLSSFSIKKKFFGLFSKIYEVRFPVPGPTSSIDFFSIFVIQLFFLIYFDQSKSFDLNFFWFYHFVI